jgi:hypothetical protein
MAFTRLPSIIPATPMPPGGMDAEAASIEQLTAAVKGGDLAALDHRQQGILASAIAVLRGVRARARSLPSEQMLGSEMHSVLVELQSLPQGSVDRLAEMLAAASDQWEQQLSQPIGVERSETQSEGA